MEDLNKTIDFILKLYSDGFSFWHALEIASKSEEGEKIWEK